MQKKLTPSGREIPVVTGELIILQDSVDESFGVPAEEAARVSKQILRALGEHSIDPASVLFSGYDDYGNEGHNKKYDGDFAHADLEGNTLPEGTFNYFFAGVEDLSDGQEGPLAYAATGERPVIGVYSIALLSRLGFSSLHRVAVATPQELEDTLVLEFYPRYQHPQFNV